ncbi:hypothetical protein [Streptomyces sp. NPDC059009]|uniref:hypothetical protein n=1 Tax=Streptomyces sp. NPDC059009 TaxID=3346694 RepID=UPI0036775DB6
MTTTLSTAYELWFLWSPLTIMTVYGGWVARSRIPGSFLGRIPGVRRLGRRSATERGRALLKALKEAGVPANDRPDETRLVERLHRFTLGIRASRAFFGAPVVLPVAALFCASVVDDRRTPLPVAGLFLGLTVFSACILAIDERSVRRSDAAGAAAYRAVEALEGLLLGRGRPSQQSALESTGIRFDHLCHALKGQARHESRKTTLRSQRDAAQLTELLLRNIRHHNHALAFATDRQDTIRELARLTSSALQYSCRPRAELANLNFVDPQLLGSFGGPEADAEPTDKRATHIAVSLLVAAALSGLAILLGRLGALGEFAPVILLLLYPHAHQAAERFGIPFPTWPTSATTGDETAGPELVNSPSARTSPRSRTLRPTIRARSARRRRSGHDAR